MSIRARFEQKSQTTARGSIRRKLRLSAVSYSSATAQSSALIHDISRTGFLMQTSAALSAHEQFEVQMPNVPAVDAQVIWNSAGFFGCRFIQPVSQAFVSAALLRSPPPAPAGHAASDGVPAAADERLAEDRFASHDINPLERDGAHNQFSPGARLGIIVALAVASWLLVLMAGWSLL